MSSRKLTRGDRPRHEKINAAVKIYNSDDDRPTAHAVSSDSHWKELQFQKHLRMRMRQGLRDKEALLVDGKGRLITLAERILRFRLHRQNGVHGEAESGMSRTTPDTKREKVNLRTLLNQYVQQREKERALSAEIIGEISAAKLSLKEDESLQGLSPAKSHTRRSSLSTRVGGDHASDDVSEKDLDSEERKEVRGSTTRSGEQSTGYSPGASSRRSRNADSLGRRKTIIVDEDGSILERVKVPEEPRYFLKGGAKEIWKDRGISQEDKSMEEDGEVGKEMLAAGEKGGYLRRIENVEENGGFVKRTEGVTEEVDNSKRSEYVEENGSVLKSTVNVESNQNILNRTEDTEENGNTLERNEDTEENGNNLKKTEDTEKKGNILKRNEDTEENWNILERNEDTEENGNNLKKTEDTEKNGNNLKRNEDTEENGNNLKINEDMEDKGNNLKRNEDTEENRGVLKTTEVTEENRGILKTTELMEENGNSLKRIEDVGKDGIETADTGHTGEQDNELLPGQSNQSKTEEIPKVEVKIGVLSSVLLVQNGKSYSSIDVTSDVNLNESTTSTTCYGNKCIDTGSQMETGEHDVFENDATKALIPRGEVIAKDEPDETATEVDASPNNAVFPFVVDKEQTKETLLIAPDRDVNEKIGLLTNEAEKKVSDDVHRNQSDKTGAEKKEETSLSSNGLKHEFTSSPKQSQRVMKETQEPATEPHYICNCAKRKHAPRRLLTEQLYGIRHATVLEKIKSKMFAPTALPKIDNGIQGRQTPKDVLAYLSRGSTEDLEETPGYGGLAARNNKIYEFIDYLNERSYTLPEIVLQGNEKQQSNKRKVPETLQGGDGVKSHFTSTKTGPVATSNERETAKTLLPRLFHERTNSTLSARGRELGDRPKTILPSVQGATAPPVAKHSISGSPKAISLKSGRVHEVKSSVLPEPPSGSGASFPEQTDSTLEDLDDREKRIIALYNDLSSYCAFHSSPSDVSIFMHRKQSRLDMRIEWGLIPTENTSYFSKVKAKKNRKEARKNSFVSSNSVATEKEGSDDSFRVHCDGQKKKLSDCFIYLREMSFSRYIQQSEMENRLKKYLEPIPELLESVPRTRKKARSPATQKHARKNKPRGHRLNLIETKPKLTLSVSRHANCFDFHTKRRLK